MTDKKAAASTPDAQSPSLGVRRISNPRPKKAPAKPAPTPPTSSRGADILPAAADAGQNARPTVPRGADILPAAADAGQNARPTVPRGADILPAAVPQTPPTAAGDWPEPDAPATGGHASQDAKRKRRRRKGKGSPAAAPAEDLLATHEPAESPVPDSPKPPRAPQPPPRQQASRINIDPELLALKAWKIYLAEVSEEGVALIGDQDARELARRCFRLAEIFLEEQSRRVPGGA